MSKKEEDGAVTDELRRIYREAWSEGIFLREFGQGDSGFLTAAGSVKKIEELEKKLGREIEVNDLQLIDCINLGALPGIGKTREESCRTAIKKYKSYYRIK